MFMKSPELLVRLRIEVEAILDFPEEEIDFITEYNCKERLEEIIRDIKQTLEIAQQGEKLFEMVLKLLLLVRQMPVNPAF